MDGVFLRLKGQKRAIDMTLTLKKNEDFYRSCTWLQFILCL